MSKPGAADSNDNTFLQPPAQLLGFIARLDEEQAQAQGVCMPLSIGSSAPPSQTKCIYHQ